MAVTAGSVEYKRIPDVPEARLMFYLDCIYEILEMDNANSVTMRRLRDYQRFTILSQEELQELFDMCTLLRPYKLINRCIFKHRKLCGRYEYNFYDKSVVEDTLKVVHSVDIGGQRRRVRRVMAIRKGWTQKYFLQPLQLLGNRLRIEAKEEHKRQVALANERDGRSKVCTIL